MSKGRAEWANLAQGLHYHLEEVLYQANREALWRSEWPSSPRRGSRWMGDFEEVFDEHHDKRTAN